MTFYPWFHGHHEHAICDGYACKYCMVVLGGGKLQSHYFVEIEIQCQDFALILPDLVSSISAGRNVEKQLKLLKGLDVN